MPAGVERIRSGSGIDDSVSWGAYDANLRAVLWALEPTRRSIGSIGGKSRYYAREWRERGGGGIEIPALGLYTFTDD